MSLDYKKISATYKPTIVKILLVGEAPPPKGDRYFYKIPEPYKLSSKDIEKDTSLPATIFNHYFGKRPATAEEYRRFLETLKENGIFLIDLYEKPEIFRNCPENLLLLFSDENIQNFQNRVSKLTNKDTEIIFLLARNYRIQYRSLLKSHFPEAKLIRWKVFRLSNEQDFLTV